MSTYPQTKICLNCNNGFSVHNRDQLTKKFCNQSCAASYNNKKRTKESRLKQQRSLTQTMLSRKISTSTLAKSKPLKTNPTTKSSSNPNLYPKTKWAIIKYTSLYLGKPKDLIEYDDVELFQDYINHEIYTNDLSPTQIATKLGIIHSNFGMFITKCLGIKLKDLSSAIQNTVNQAGKTITDPKRIYYKECEFRFTRAEMKKIPGFELFVKHGCYHSTKNPNGIVRDHIVSRADGWQNGYNPEHIRHPANCRFITNFENIKKNSSSSMTYQELLERIGAWEKDIVPTLQAKSIPVPKTPEHIEKIRSSILKMYARKKQKV